MSNLIRADLLYELSNYEEILKEAIDTSNVDIIQFCEDTVYTYYVDLCNLLGLSQNEDIQDVYDIDMDYNF